MPLIFLLGPVLTWVVYILLLLLIIRMLVSKYAGLYFLTLLGFIFAMIYFIHNNPF